MPEQLEAAEGKICLRKKKKEDKEKVRKFLAAVISCCYTCTFIFLRTIPTFNPKGGHPLHAYSFSYGTTPKSIPKGWGGGGGGVACA